MNWLIIILVIIGLIICLVFNRFILWGVLVVFILMIGLSYGTPILNLRFLNDRISPVIYNRARTRSSSPNRRETKESNIYPNVSRPSSPNRREAKRSNIYPTLSRSSSPNRIEQNAQIISARYSRDNL